MTTLFSGILAFPSGHDYEGEQADMALRNEPNKIYSCLAESRLGLVWWTRIYESVL